MKPHWALLLDLDQTLVFTEALQSMREGRQWKEVSSYYYLTRLPEHTKAFLDRVRSHFLLGVVTASPRQYAESLVQYHDLGINIVTAYHDTQRHKPDPQPLLHAAAQLGIPPTRCVHIGDQAKDVVAACEAHMVAVALSWDRSLDSRTLPMYSYTSCTDWYEVLIYLKGLTKGR